MEEQDCKVWGHIFRLKMVTAILMFLSGRSTKEKDLPMWIAMLNNVFFFLISCFWCPSDLLLNLVQEYLQGNPLWLQYIKAPLVTLGYETSYDVFVKAHGGGLSGQAQAITLGVARALLRVSQDHRSPLKKEGLLTRDSRVVERKKPGLHKARKAPQYSKRWGWNYSVMDC